MLIYLCSESALHCHPEQLAVEQNRSEEGPKNQTNHDSDSKGSIEVEVKPRQLHDGNTVAQLPGFRQ